MLSNTSSLEPSTETVLGTVSNRDVADFQMAIVSAEIAQEPYWLSTTGAQRGALLRKWHGLLIENQDD